MSRTILLPGWLQVKDTYEGFDVYNIWEEGLPLEFDSDADVVIGHSIGANIALLIFEDIDEKFILVNPLIPKRNIVAWTCLWLRSIAKFGTSRSTKPTYASIKKILHLLRFDPMKSLSKIPKENIVIIRGKEDNYFFNEKSSALLQALGFNVLTLETGHTWSEVYAKFIENLISEKNETNMAIIV